MFFLLQFHMLKTKQTSKKEKEELDLYDLWTRPNQWLAVSDILRLLQLNWRENKVRCIGILRELKEGASKGIFRRRKVLRRIMVLRKNCPHIRRRKVHVYSPAPWVLHSICNGFYEKNLAKHTQHGRFLFQISEEGM